MSLKGRWRIVEMELWDEDAIDLIGPAFIEIDAKRHRVLLGRQRQDGPGEWTRLGHGRIRRLAGGADLLPHGGRLVVSSRAEVESLTDLSNFWTTLDVCRTS
jgi:hypothetical protein